MISHRKTSTSAAGATVLALVGGILALGALGGLSSAHAYPPDYEPGQEFEATYLCEGRLLTAAELADRRGIEPQMVELLRLSRSVGPTQLCDIPETKLARAIFRIDKPKPHHPGAAIAFRLLQQQDENCNIPPHGYIPSSAPL